MLWVALIYYGGSLQLFLAGFVGLCMVITFASFLRNENVMWQDSFYFLFWTGDLLHHMSTRKILLLINSCYPVRKGKLKQYNLFPGTIKITKATYVYFNLEYAQST